MKLSDKQGEALTKAKEAGGLRYVRGGYWVQATVEPKDFLERLGNPTWYAPTGTVQALVRRGLLVWSETARSGYPTKASLP